MQGRHLGCTDGGMAFWLAAEHGQPLEPFKA